MEASYNEKMALFRYQVILPLLDGALTSEDERRIKAQILEKEWKYPDGSNGRIKDRTFRHWLLKYRREGFDGLFYGNRQPSKLKGVCKAISAEHLNVARELREEDPRRSTELILRLMAEGKGLDVTGICARTVQRFFKKLGLKRGRRVKGKGQHERWEQQLTNKVWHGDTAHTFCLADPYNPDQKRKAKLIVFVDDASRVIPHGEFYFDEQLPSVLDALVKGLLKCGKPERILLDNAKTFRSTTLELMCAELDIGLNFCRPRRPQGKGKIERMIRNIKESFCNEAENAPNITTLEELNAAFRGWLDGYENREHGELEGLTPVQRWRKDEMKVDRSLTEARIYQAMMLRETRTVHISTALVTVGRGEYQVNREHAGKEVQVRWNPEKLEQVEVWMDGRFVESAPLKERKPHVERDWRQDQMAEEPKGKKSASAGEYCAALMGEGASKVAKARGRDDLFKLSDFLEVLSTQLGRAVPFEEEELLLIVPAFKRLAPLERAATVEKLARAVEDKGSEQHVRFYLERLEPTAFRR
ncbi:MAG: DDE-type integrase/transposase/recombinase [Ktedonobacteraceae bacterium]